MKNKTTQKAIKNTYTTIIKVNYCRLQYLLNLVEPIAYTSGIYGWNADIYHFGDVAIVTGYNPFGNIVPDYDIIKAFDDRAAEILSDIKSSYEDKKQALYNLTMEFIATVTTKHWKEWTTMKDYLNGIKNNDYLKNAYIVMIENRYTRTDSEKNWRSKPETSITKRIDYAIYYNIFDSIPFMKSLGGREIIAKEYTYAGYIPTQLTSVSPTSENKTVRRFYFYHTETEAENIYNLLSRHSGVK